MQTKLSQSDRRFLAEAVAEAGKSEDPKARINKISGVGVIIANKGGIIGRSANVIPPKINLHDPLLRHNMSNAERYIFIEHAERAAIYSAMREGRNLEGADIYCSRFPCVDCARAIVWSGITRVFVAQPISPEDPWHESQDSAERVLNAARIDVVVDNGLKF